ncbi:MAG: alpha/beta hydrolase [Phycisphaerae bacterium]|nr:alpha/beta hydrolase [Gemmatimonadaceae bacterium]
MVAVGETLSVFWNTEASSRDVAGDSQPMVVFVPGPIGSAFGMRHLTGALADSGTATLTIDLLGMGQSGRPASADYSLSQQAVRLAAALDSLRIRRALLVAHGVSASVAYRHAASRPANVAGIVSISGGPVDQQKTDGVNIAITFGRLVDNPIGRALARRKFTGEMRKTSADDSWSSSAVMKEYFSPYERNMRGSLRALQQMGTATEPHGIATVLAGIRAPVRLLVGSKVSGNTPTAEQMALLQRSVPQFRVDTIPKSGSWIHEESPRHVLIAIRALLGQSVVGVP